MRTYQNLTLDYTNHDHEKKPTQTQVKTAVDALIRKVYNFQHAINTNMYRAVYKQYKKVAMVYDHASQQWVADHFFN